MCIKIHKDSVPFSWTDPTQKVNMYKRSTLTLFVLNWTKNNILINTIWNICVYHHHFLPRWLLSIRATEKSVKHTQIKMKEKITFTDLTLLIKAELDHVLI